MNVQSGSLQLLPKEAILTLTAVDISALSFNWSSGLCASFEDPLHTPPHFCKLAYRNVSTHLRAEEVGKRDERLLSAEEEKEKEEKSAKPNLADSSSDSAEAGPGDRGQEDDQGPKPKKIA